MEITLKNTLEESLKFLKSTDFSKAFVLTIAVTTSVAVCVFLDAFEVGLAMAIGALLSSPSDVPGSFRHKVIGIILAAVLAVIVSIIAGYAAFNFWVLIMVMSILMFGISYFAVFGFRASLVAFSGLFALVLSFANISEVLEIWERALFIGLGGIWYLTLTVAWYFMNPERPTEQLLAECIQLTTNYLRIRAELLTANTMRKELQKELILLQSDLNDKHEALREILISSRKTSGTSNYARKRLLIFIELVDILELAMANPVNYEKMDVLLKDEPGQIKLFENLINAAANHLEHISKVLVTNVRLQESELENHLNIIEEGLTIYRDKIDISSHRESILLQRNLYDYQQKQVQKINSITRILQNFDTKKVLFIKNKDASRFITSQDYDPKILIENFNFNSPIFKHSLRLAIIVLIGFSIGSYFSVENAYWILLTIIVIMRPNYGLTKERSKHRMVGTIIGAIIAVAIVLAIQNKTVYAILAIISLIMAFSLIQKNYKTSAVFITLSIVFIYSLLQPDVLNVIQYRVIDTFIGAGLAAIGNFILWPSWEVQSIKKVIADSIKANRKYLQEIDKIYQEKTKITTSYKLARKQAFIEMGNLSASFQRMTQEPKSRQKDLPPIYEIVGLNQTFLSSLASLGTFIQNHQTTEASRNFDILVHYINLNLENCEKLIAHKEILSNDGETRILEAKEALNRSYGNLVEERNKEIEAGKNKIDRNMRLRLQEAQLINDQLEWLLDISDKLRKTIAETESI